MIVIVPHNGFKYIVTAYRKFSLMQTEHVNLRRSVADLKTKSVENIAVSGGVRGSSYSEMKK